jgi:imidazolonepropionase-like amidohydrolase
MKGKRILAVLGVVLGLTVAMLVVVLGVLPLPHVDVPERVGLRIAGLTIVQPGQGRRLNHSLTLANGQIEVITPTASTEISNLEELRGAYALPGLVDMHVHHMPDIAGLTQLWDLLLVAHGVTTVRDLGVTSATDSGPMVSLSKRVENGDVIGPRILYCGPTLDGDPPSISHFRAVRSADEARETVTELAKDGCSCVKTYNLMGPELFHAVHHAAEEQSLRHVAHLPNGMDVSDVRDIELQHYAGIGSAETIERFSDYWVRWPDLSEADLAEIVTMSRDQNITHTPTMAMWTNMSLMFNPDAKSLPHARLLPRFFRDVMWTAEGGEPQLRTLTAKKMDALAQVIPKMQQLTRMLHAGGVPTFVGTDPVMPHSVPGRAVHQEMRLFVEAGFTPEQVWEIATKAAGDWLGNPRIGRLEAGAYADVLFFKKDPTRDLAHLDTLAGVIADGRYYSRQALDEAITKQREHFEGDLYDTLTMTVANLYF